MDPNANLAEQDRILRAVNGRVSHLNRAQRDRMRELVAALREWIFSGGFAPTWDAYPYATSRFCSSAARNRAY